LTVKFKIMERNLIQMPYDYFEAHPYECIDSKGIAALENM